MSPDRKTNFSAYNGTEEVSVIGYPLIKPHAETQVFPSKADAAIETHVEHRSPQRRRRSGK